MAMTHPSLAAQIRHDIESQYPVCRVRRLSRRPPRCYADEVLAAALVVASEPGFERRLRACYKCRRTVELTAQE
jgi:hypothetical protein